MIIQIYIPKVYWYSNKCLERFFCLIHANRQPSLTDWWRECSFFTINGRHIKWGTDNRFIALHSASLLLKISFFENWRGLWHTLERRFCRILRETVPQTPLEHQIHSSFHPVVNRWKFVPGVASWLFSMPPFVTWREMSGWGDQTSLATSRNRGC